MSGHSKWSTIKRKKGAADAARGKLFTRLIKEITIAARIGGGDVDGNPRLRTAVANAKAQNMPKENIDRAIKKGTGELEGVTYEEILYEGYGPGGVAIMIESLTDNKNRTVSDVRFTLGKHNGSLGTSNSVAYMFSKKGLITVLKEGADEEALMELALEAGAEDIKDEDDIFEIITDPADLETVREAVEGAGLEIESAEQARIPSTTVALDNKAAVSFLKLLDGIEDLDDVQNFWHNAEFRRDSTRGRSNIGLVIGIDPGSKVTGYALVEAGPGSGPVCRLAGEIRPSPTWPLSRRLAAVFEGLDRIIAQHRPLEMAVEDIFFAKNARSALALGHVRGVALLAAARNGLPVATYSPNAIKKSVVGYGRASKDQVGRMVCSLLSIREIPGQDVTDALACAVCHLNSSATEQRLKAALEKQ